MLEPIVVTAIGVSVTGCVRTSEIGGCDEKTRFSVTFPVHVTRGSHPLKTVPGRAAALLGLEVIA